MYYQPDISDSDIYNQSMRYQCNLKEQKTLLEDSTDMRLEGYSLSGDKTHMRCFKDPVLEQKLRTDTYDITNKCGGPTVPYVRNSSTKTYSECLGYDCNREDNEFMYKLDEFNTYHNYPVCKLRGDSKQLTCCPENTQLYNNVTRRSMAFEQSPKAPKDIPALDRYFFDIPDLKYNKCYL